MKKVIISLLVLVMTVSLFAGCKQKQEESSQGGTSGTESSETSGGGESSNVATETILELAIMVPSATHGWTGAVLSYAQEKAAALNADPKFSAKYEAKVYAATDVENQIQHVDDLLANAARLGGIVILPFDNGLQASLERIAAENVPYVQYDRVISSEVIDGTVLANVKGDNEGIGYETAKRFMDNGLEKDHFVYEMIGDNSSVPELRSKGFRDYLREVGWTEAEIDAVVLKSPATGWSRDNGKDLFESWFGSAQNDPNVTTWIYTHDDEIGVGVLESLNSNALDESKKAIFLENFQALAASSGLAEMYAILRDKHQTLGYPETFDLFSVTYDPGMIQESVDVMVNFLLDGTTVEQNYVIPVSVVDAGNVDQFQAFGSYSER